MKRRIWCAALMAVMMLGLLSGCGGGGGSGLLDGVQAGDGGKVLNIYVWNEEFQGKFNENHPEVEKLSSDKSVAYPTCPNTPGTPSSCGFWALCPRS